MMPAPAQGRCKRGQRLRLHSTRHAHDQELDCGEHAARQDEGITAEFMADAGGGWKSPIQAHWARAANSEQYRSARYTVPADAAIDSFRALSPLGTHHTVLTVSHNPTEPDG